MILFAPLRYSATRQDPLRDVCLLAGGLLEVYFKVSIKESFSDSFSDSFFRILSTTPQAPLRGPLRV